MTKTLKHKLVSAIADGADATLVRPIANWNDDHDLFYGYRSLAATDAVAQADHLTYLVYTGATAATLSLPAPAGGNFPVGWTCKVRNNASAAVTLTLNGAGGATVNGASSLVLRQNETLDLLSTGAPDYFGKVANAPVSARYGGLLSLVSTTQLKFAPFEGAFLRLNSRDYPIPAAGITMANTAVYVNGVAAQNLAANTNYWITLFDNGGVLTPDFRTASFGGNQYGHGQSYQTPGMEGTEILINKGAAGTGYTEMPDRVIIGQAYITSPVAFTDTALFRYTRSWFNDGKPLQLFNTINGIQTAYTVAFSPLAGDVNFLTWQDEKVFCGYYGYCIQNTVSVHCYYSGWLNGAGFGPTSYYTSWDGVGYAGPVILGSAFKADERVNQFLLSAFVSSGASTTYGTTVGSVG